MYVLPTFWNPDLMMLGAVSQTSLSAVSLAGRADHLEKNVCSRRPAAHKGFLAAFALKLPVMVVYCIVNLDEIVKIPAVYLHYKKYIWVRNITREED